MDSMFRQARSVSQSSLILGGCTPDAISLPSKSSKSPILTSCPSLKNVFSCSGPREGRSVKKSMESILLLVWTGGGGREQRRFSRSSAKLGFLNL